MNFRLNDTTRFVELSSVLLFNLEAKRDEKRDEIFTSAVELFQI